jgi:hypothetical protein
MTAVATGSIGCISWPETCVVSRKARTNQIPHRAFTFMIGN